MTGKFDEAYHRSSIFRSAVPIKGLSAVFAPIWALKWFVTLYSGTRFPCNKTKLNFVLDSILKIPPTWYQAGPRCHTPCAYPAPGVQHQANWHLLCNHCLDTFLSRLHSRYVLQKQCAADKTQTCRIRLLNNICLLKLELGTD